MAIITLGGGVAQASGSVGGTTYSRNRGGPYMRTRAIPVNPGSAYQSIVRAALATLTARWGDTLTPAERAAWDTYALNVPLPNPLGQPRNVGGVGMYVRSNVSRIQASSPIVDTAPIIQNLGEYTNPSIVSVTASTGVASIGFEDTDAWCDEDDSALYVYGARAQSATINFFKGPYRHAGAIQGNSTTPPTSPLPVTLPFPIAVGQLSFLRFAVSRADGRLSADFRAVTTAS